ncbi:MAG TPA: hypothetical protein VFL76_00985 [Edaphocola sp.]|nr:hypothetical protein [Edaphocola sp.]
MDTKYQEDIAHIHAMMERSSRFISLSGLSGIGAGSVALIASGLAYYWLQEQGLALLKDRELAEATGLTGKLALTGLLALAAALFCGVFFTLRKSRKQQQPVWNSLTRRLLRSLVLPLAAGELFCIALMAHHHFVLVAPATLVFYGLALVNAGKYTFRDIEYLGVAELVLGLAAMFLTGYGLLFWAAGFGLLHIIYGARMHIKYH